MTEQTRRRLAWTIWIVGVIALVAGTAFRVIVHQPFHPADISEPGAFVAIGVVGLIVSLHQPRNAIGWIYLVVWIAAAGMFELLQDYAYWAELSHPSAPGETLAVWLGNWTWVPIFTLLLAYPFLLFPDGHVPSPRWRPVAWAIGIVAALWSVSFALEGADYTDALGRSVPNPFAIDALVPFFDGARVVLSFVILGLMVAAVGSLVVRYRRSRGDEREQIRWLMLAAGITVVWFALPLDHGVGGWVDFVQGLVLTLIPISIGVAILKYRLYDVDVVISKALVFGVLGAFITLVYVAMVVGVGSVIGSGGNAVLSGLAAAVVALAFQPVRRRAQRVANRLVYGKRATPYEVLSGFSERLAGSYSIDDVLPRMAQIVATGTGADRADVWLSIGGELRDEAAWPPEATPKASIPVTDIPESFVVVYHQGERLGALSVSKKASDPLRPNDVKLLRDLAAQAGLVLRNVRLIEELKASRQRLVRAQDEERRRLERNIHDGAQQQLVALSVKERLAEAMIGKDDEGLRTLLRELQSDTSSALEDLRDLARGIYPPLLADKGLAAALEAQARKAAVTVTLQADGIGRFAQDVEATVYFCALEALNNVAKYAGVTHATIRLTNGTSELRFEVADDGRGFDPTRTGYGTGLQGMADRLAGLGGELTVQSTPGHGTTVRGRVRAEARS